MRVWSSIARSQDEGRTFGEAEPVPEHPIGACGCCAPGLSVGPDGTVYVGFRAAHENINRDTYLFTSEDQGETFRSTTLSRWKLKGCPHGIYRFSSTPSGALP